MGLFSSCFGKKCKQPNNGYTEIGVKRVERQTEKPMHPIHQTEPDRVPQPRQASRPGSKRGGSDYPQRPETQNKYQDCDKALGNDTTDADSITYYLKTSYPKGVPKFDY